MLAETSAANTGGRYAGVSGDWRLELRLDIEGASALDIVSGDLWRRQEHISHFLVHGPPREHSSLSAQLPGGGRLTIRLADSGEAAVELTEMGPAFACRRISPFFQELTLQPAIEPDLCTHWLVDGFSLLPRLADVYAQAGISLIWRTPCVVNKPASETGWTEVDLREVLAPLGHSFLFASRHQAANIRGLTVKNGGAVFLHSMAGPTEAAHRHALFTCVHEIGHTLQLPHALPAECSWMSIPARYPGGEELFFRHFEAQFLYRELQYLRHGSRPASTGS